MRHFIGSVVVATCCVGASLSASRDASAGDIDAAWTQHKESGSPQLAAGAGSWGVNGVEVWVTLWVSADGTTWHGFQDWTVYTENFIIAGAGYALWQDSPGCSVNGYTANYVQVEFNDYNGTDVYTPQVAFTGC